MRLKCSAIDPGVWYTSNARPRKNQVLSDGHLEPIDDLVAMEEKLGHRYRHYNVSLLWRPTSAYI